MVRSRSAEAVHWQVVRFYQCRLVEVQDFFGRIGYKLRDERSNFFIYYNIQYV